MRHRLIAVAAAALLPALAMLAYNEFAARRQRDVEIHQQTLQASRQAAAEVDRVLDGMRTFLVATATIPAVEDRQPEACAEVLRRITAKLTSVRTIAVLDTQGHLVCDGLGTKPGLDLSDRPYFRKAIEKSADADLLREMITGSYSPVSWSSAGWPRRL